MDKLTDRPKNGSCRVACVRLEERQRERTNPERKRRPKIIEKRRLLEIEREKKKGKETGKEETGVIS